MKSESIRWCTHCNGHNGNCDECAGSGWIAVAGGSFATGGVISSEAAERKTREIEANA